jgi:hypothetical protein
MRGPLRGRCCCCSGCGGGGPPPAPFAELGPRLRGFVTAAAAAAAAPAAAGFEPLSIVAEAQLPGSGLMKR